MTIGGLKTRIAQKNLGDLNSLRNDDGSPRNNNIATLKIDALGETKHDPILGTQSSTRGLHDLRKWVFRDGTDIHTDTHTDMATY